MMRRPLRGLLLFCTGGVLYFCIELAYRGWSHPVMALVGGACFWGVGGINEVLPWDVPVEIQALLGAAIITGVELASGIVINLWMGMNVWSYAGQPGNILGQICPKTTALWYVLAYPAIFLDDWLRWNCGEEQPRYRWR